jgi:5-(carboxyamino)imidazole ribonucleotide synthase
MRVGILGAGQLSRMLALAGIPMDVEFSFYDSNLAEPTRGLGKIFHAGYDDFDSLTRFANSVDVITYENENIPLAAIDHLLSINPNIYPNKEALRMSQDRLLEKELFRSLGIPTVEYRTINNKQELVQACEAFSYHVILKTRREGYDGKGQIRISDINDLVKINEDNCRNAIVESLVKFDREISLIAACGRQGEMKFYDVCENVHHKGILHRTMNKPRDKMFAIVKEYVTQVATQLKYVGILTVEFFQRGEELIANEMAPRVHNSGHWTIEGAVTSQFANALNAVLGEPLGDTASIGEATMFNLLGVIPEKMLFAHEQNLFVHDYEKIARQGRKLGHITLLSQAEDRIEKIEKILQA